VKAQTFLLTLVAAAALLITVSAPAQVLYENGPINGEFDAQALDEGFVVSDSFTISTGSSTLSGMSFGAWLFPGDILDSVDVQISSGPLGSGTTYLSQQLGFAASGCFVNQYGFNVCTETATLNGPILGNGTYWVSLSNAVVNDGDPAFWDENSGIGCHSPGCPSQVEYNGEGTIVSEAFSILGTSSGTGTVPEPESLLLFASAGVLVLAGIKRHKIF